MQGSEETYFLQDAEDAVVTQVHGEAPSVAATLDTRQLAVLREFQRDGVGILGSVARALASEPEAEGERGARDAVADGADAVGALARLREVRQLRVQDVEDLL